MYCLSLLGNVLVFDGVIVKQQRPDFTIDGHVVLGGVAALIKGVRHIFRNGNTVDALQGLNEATHCIIAAIRSTAQAGRL